MTATRYIFSHVGLEVPHVDDHLVFWTTLGGTPRRADGGPAVCEFPDMNVVIHEGSGEGGTVGSSVNHICFAVPSLEPVAARLRAAGFTVEPAHVPTQVWAWAPDGVRVEILEDAGVHVPVRGHHIHFFTPAPLEMQAWYALTFGAVPGRRMHFDAADIASRDTTMNLTFSASEGAVLSTCGRALDHIAFRVEGAEAPEDILDPWGTRITLTAAVPERRA